MAYRRSTARRGRRSYAVRPTRTRRPARRRGSLTGRRASAGRTSRVVIQVVGAPAASAVPFGSVASPVPRTRKF